MKLLNDFVPPSPHFPTIFLSKIHMFLGPLPKRLVCASGPAWGAKKSPLGSLWAARGVILAAWGPLLASFGVLWVALGQFFGGPGLPVGTSKTKKATFRDHAFSVGKTTYFVGLGGQMQTKVGARSGLWGPLGRLGRPAGGVWGVFGDFGVVLPGATLGRFCPSWQPRITRM